MALSGACEQSTGSSFGPFFIALFDDLIANKFASTLLAAKWPNLQKKTANFAENYHCSGVSLKELQAGCSGGR